MQSTRQPQTLRGVTRPPEAGNLIWKHYLNLSQVVAGEFRAAYQAGGYGVTGWRADTKLARKLGDIPTARFQFYRTFFLHQGLPDLLEDFWNEQSPAVQDSFWAGQPIHPAGPRPE